jgi:hypothetical protein
LAYAGHDSTIHIATLTSATPVVRTVRLQALPMTSLLFISETALAAAGHDFTPQIFTANRSGKLYCRLLFLCGVRSK